MVRFLRATAVGVCPRPRDQEAAVMKGPFTAAAFVLIGLVTGGTASAGIISAQAYLDDTDFAAAVSGLVSLTGTLPNIGNAGTSVTVGDATLSAGNTIFIEDGWSTLIAGNEIAISGPENLDVSLNVDPSTAFGFYFHEPGTATTKLNGCNTACVDSTFTISFYLNNVLVGSTLFAPANDSLIFWGVILDTAFDEVRFVETIGGIDNEFFGEMYVAPIPEPATVVLLGTGLAAAAARRRFRRRAEGRGRC
jgi:hypothetical protein